MPAKLHRPLCVVTGCGGGGSPWRRWCAGGFRLSGIGYGILCRMNTNYQKVKEWRSANPKKVLEQARRYRAKHPETNLKAKSKYREGNLEKIRESDRERQRKRRKIDPDGNRRRMDAYKIRQETIKSHIAGRNRPENCDICGEKSKIVFDHCHARGHFRGWICDRCNKVLGMVKDSQELLGKLSLYLETDNGKVDSKEA